MLSIGFCTSETNEVLQEKIEQNIQKNINLYPYKKNNKIFRIDYNLVRAIIYHESKFNPYCVRYERKLKLSTWYNNILSEEEKKDKIAYSSLGLMQVLFGTAKKYGYTGKPEDLIVIENSLKYGMLYLRELLEKNSCIEDVLAIYNGGVKIKIAGKYRNQDYVNIVMQYYQKFKENK